MFFWPLLLCGLALVVVNEKQRRRAFREGVFEKATKEREESVRRQVEKRKEEERMVERERKRRGWMGGRRGFL